MPLRCLGPPAAGSPAAAALAISNPRSLLALSSIYVAIRLRHGCSNGAAAIKTPHQARPQALVLNSRSGKELGGGEDWEEHTGWARWYKSKGRAASPGANCDQLSVWKMRSGGRRDKTAPAGASAPAHATSGRQGTIKVGRGGGGKVPKCWGSARALGQDGVGVRHAGAGWAGSGGGTGRHVAARHAATLGTASPPHSVHAQA